MSESLKKSSTFAKNITMTLINDKLQNRSSDKVGKQLYTVTAMYHVLQQ